MRLVTVELPDSYVEQLQELYWGLGMSRGRLIQIAIRDLLVKEFRLHPELNERERVEPEKVEPPKEKQLYYHCLNCGCKLHEPKEPYSHKKFKIIEFKFCCDCYKIYKDFSFDQFPPKIITRIEKFLYELS